MQNIRVQPFSQFTNWFRLRPGEGSIYKVHATADTPESVEVFTYRENLYSLQPTDKCESIVPTGDLLRRSIGRAFREALRLKGFRFKGKGGYVAFWHKHPAEQPTTIYSAPSPLASNSA